MPPPQAGPMTLRTRASLIVSASFLALVALLLAAAVIVVLGRFSALEADVARQGAERALDALNEMAVTLSATASDWSHWDDTAAFVAGRNPGFIRANLADTTFLTLRLDVAVFLGPDGHVVYHRAYDRAGHHDGPLPEGVDSVLSPGSALAHHETSASHREGILVLPGGIFLVASQPITDSLGAKPPVGTLVFMRSLDAVEVQRIAALLRQTISLTRLEKAGLSPAQVKEAAARPRVFLVPDGRSRMDAILPVRDALGNFRAALDVQGTRRVYRDGLLSIEYLAFSLVACSLLSAVLLFVLLSRMVLSPLGRLASAVRGIGAVGGSGRLEAGGSDELSEVALSINGMLDALAASEGRRAVLEERFSHVNKLEAIGTLAGGVAHDFNNILTAITGFCDLLDESLAGGPAAEVEQIRKAADRAASLTSQLLAFSRRQRLEYQAVDLNAMLSGMAEGLRLLIGGQQALELNLAPDLRRVRGDPGQLQQAVQNLAVNARDAMPDGGTLTIATANLQVDRREESERLGTPPGSYVRCTVKDTGTGMEEATRRRVFEPFFTTKELGKGTGLGLSVVWGIVRQCDGVISVASEPGQGTCFEILLPAALEAGGKPDAVPRAGPAAAAGGTILLVEDEEPIRVILAKALAKAGYRTLEASDGVEALALVTARGEGEEEIRLLLTDVAMPRMGGAELAARLRERDPGMKVLFMSGNADLQGAAAPLEAGAPLLQKPFNTRSLVEAIAEILRS